VRIAAQAKTGEMLREVAERGERKQRGGDQAKSHGATLPERGVTKSESSRWQRSPRCRWRFAPGTPR